MRRMYRFVYIGLFCYESIGILMDQFLRDMSRGYIKEGSFVFQCPCYEQNFISKAKHPAQTTLYYTRG